MPTARQKRVAKLIIENATLDKPLNGGQMLEKVSYSKGIQSQPSRVLESEGVLDALNDFGFNENNAKSVVSEILMNNKIKPDTRINAAKEVFKVHGSYAPEKTSSTHLNVELKLENKELEAIRVKYEEELKNKLLS